MTQPYWAACSWGAFAITVFVGTITTLAKADTDVYTWAEKEAKKQLSEEGVI